MSPDVPVAAYYLCFFAALGLFFPLFPLYLSDHGVPAHVVTRIAAIFPLATMVAPPTIGLLADALRARAWILRGATILCALAVLAYLRAPTGTGALIAVTVVFAFLRAPLGTLVDAAAYRTAELSGGSYGRLRLFGSIGFLVAVLVGGELAEALGWDAVLAAVALCYALAIVAAFLLPSAPPERRPFVLPAWFALLRRRELWLFLGTIVISQLASAAYDSCYSLHLKQLGYHERFVAVAWAIGVVAEVAVLAYSGRLVAAWGAEWLLAGAFATASLRWLLVASATSAPAILALQLLHGITFPLYWVPAVIVVQTLAPRELSTAAQGLLAAAAGLGSVIGMSLAGQLLETRGGAQLYTYAAAAAFLAAIGAMRLPRSRPDRVA